MPRADPPPGPEDAPPPGSEVVPPGSEDDRRRYAERAVRAQAAMQAEFGRRNGRYRRDGAAGRLGAPAHLWPFARAFVATLDLAGIEPRLLEAAGGFDPDAVIAGHLAALERYWDSRGPVPAYASDPPGIRVGGDRYYDDNAWVGLALVQLERLRPGAGRLDRAEQLFQFAVSGWDHSEAPNPGGVFWVEQGRGIGKRNHDRNTVSSAPNAELGLHLAELRGEGPKPPAEGPKPPAEGPKPPTEGRKPPAEEPKPPGGRSADAAAIGPEQMYAWVLANLDAGGDSEQPGTGLFWDKIRGDGTIDRTLWSYNQGNMIGAAVLFARRGGAGSADHLARAEAIARKALRHYAGGGLERQPAAFNAIFFRNLLLLHAATHDQELRGEIITALRAYVDDAWERARDPQDRFHLGSEGVTLLGQSAIVQLLALLAWRPEEYAQLA